MTALKFPAHVPMGACNYITEFMEGTNGSGGFVSLRDSKRKELSEVEQRLKRLEASGDVIEASRERDKYDEIKHQHDYRHYWKRWHRRRTNTNHRKPAPPQQPLQAARTTVKPSTCVPLRPYWPRMPVSGYFPQFGQSRWPRCRLAGIRNRELAGPARGSQGLNPPEEVLNATEEYKNDMDLIGNWLEECCIVTPRATAKASSLYNSYKQWVEDNGGHPISSTKFGLKMGDRGFKKEKSGTMTYYGVGILEGSDRWEGNSETRPYSSFTKTGPEKPSQPSELSEWDDWDNIGGVFASAGYGNGVAAAPHEW